MLIVGFAGGALRSGLGSIGALGRNPRRGDKLYFAHELAAPGLIDSGAKLTRHWFELAFPVFAVSRDFKASGVAAERARMIRQHLADDRWPCARKPRERRFRALHSPDSAAQKISSLVHGEPDSITAQHMKKVTKAKGKN